uniref:Protein-tyrosine-phosphatase n=1 Tax=Caenorhabditis japonica TaxID=281687 RepID=A0A8R1I2M1_CAEJA
MTNKTQGGKKSQNTKNTRDKREKTAEEKTAVTMPAKKGLKKQPSKSSVIEEKKKSSADVKKCRSTMTLDKAPTTDGEGKGKKKEKWQGEEAAKSFAKTLTNVNMVTEYEDIQKMSVNVERCKIWQANQTRNRHADYKCYDDNRVIVQMCKNDYINATKINVPNFTPSVYLAQLPKLEIVDAVEEFWRMVFQDQCQNVHIIARPDELHNPGIEKLFAQETGAYLYANGFFINTRKVDKKDSAKADVFVVELLPEGCSNSVMCTVYLHTYWKPFTGPDRFGAQIKAAQQIAKNENGNSPTIIASVKGAGRNAALLALAVIVDHLNKGKEPKINDIVRAVREQRPLSVDSLPQYASLYLATNWFIKAKLTAGPATEDTLSKLKKFNEKATSILPNSVMRQPTEEA